LCAESQQEEGLPRETCGAVPTGTGGAEKLHNVQQESADGIVGSQGRELKA